MLVNLIRGASLAMVAGALLAVLSVPFSMPTPALAGSCCSPCAQPKCDSCAQKSSCSKCSPNKCESTCNKCESKCNSCKPKCNKCESKCNSCKPKCNKCESKCNSCERNTCNKCAKHSCNKCSGDYSRDSDADPNYNNGDVFGF
jgi:hypothetical protein